VGNLISIARPNGTTTAIGYDLRNRVSAVVHRDGAAAILASEIYTRDALGNTTRVQRADGSRVEYAYDDLSRVTEERHLDPGGALLSRVMFAYDGVGNLIGRGDSASPAVLVYNDNDQLVSAGDVTYLYDAAGRRIEEQLTPGGATLQYTWDARDRLVRFEAADGTTTTYDYDFGGIRQEKATGAGTNRFLVDRYNATTHPQIRALLPEEEAGSINGAGTKMGILAKQGSRRRREI
jgi:YD repeat-containing protein